MPVKFFGQFLVERGLVTRDAILQALDLQERTNQKFGETAISMDLMTHADVDRVHRAQRSEDLRFGDIAVKLGILSDEQMQRVLTRQKNNHLFIGEALVKVGALARDELIRFLDEFRKEQAPYVQKRAVLPEGVANADLWAVFADLTYKMLTRVADIPFRPGICEKIGSLGANDLTVAMEVGGSLRARYLLSVCTSVREQIARAILKEDSVAGESKEMLDDTVMEFVNVVCGNAVAKAAQMGYTLEVKPPEVVVGGAAEGSTGGGCSGLLFPIHVAGGERLEMALFPEA